MPNPPGPPCRICGESNYGDGLCRKHWHWEYERKRRRLDQPGVNFRRTVFETRFDRHSDGCWYWLGNLDNEGYGRYGHVLAHRVSYYLYKGLIPEGFQVDHLCGHPSCVNPEHLEAVVPRTNWERSLAISRLAALRDTCVNGHPYTPENTYVGPAGYRVCRICNNAAARRYLARKKASQMSGRR